MLEQNSSDAGLTTKSESQPSKKTLGRCVADLESVVLEVCDIEGDIPDDIAKRFEDAQASLTEKVDHWIFFIDAAKQMIAMAKEREERARKIRKTTENVLERLKNYIKFVTMQAPELKLKGTEGTLCVQKNPKSVKYAFDFQDKTVYRTVDPAFLSLEPSMSPYVKSVTHYILDHDKVKKDLEAGMKLGWAEIHQDHHIRIR